LAEDIPVKLVLDLRQKGLDNEKIITELKNRNYNYKQIRDALEQASIKKTVLSSPSGPAPEIGVPPPPPPPGMMVMEEMPPPPEMMMQQAPAPQPMMAPPMPQKRGIDIDEIQRIIEEIIEEKWSESEKRLKHLEEWKTEITATFSGLQKRMDDFSSSIASMQGVLGEKTEEFNESMQSVDTEMRALEKALNRIVPSLSDNIKELRDIVSGVKEK